jgi:hypothetical protein
VNLYSYALNNPTIVVDPKGLETFICDRPIKGCERGASPPKHVYVCVKDGENGGIVCGSTTPTGWFKFYTKGRPTTSEDGDVFNPRRCESVEPDDQCMDRCVAEYLNRPERPQYGWPGIGMDCKEYSRYVVMRCRMKCFLMNDYMRGLHAE